jgi:malonate transporter MadM subunit
MDLIEKIINKNDLIFAFLVVGVIVYVSFFISKKLTKNKIPGSAIAIFTGLVLAYFGGKKGISDLPMFTGMGLLGGAMLRDFSIVATAMGASFAEIKRAGLAGILSLFFGVILSFFVVALLM